MEINITGFGSGGPAIKSIIIQQMKRWPLGIRESTQEIQLDETEEEQPQIIFSKISNDEELRLVETLSERLDALAGSMHKELKGVYRAHEVTLTIIAPAGERS